MRIISGSLRGKSLLSPDCDKTRPTSEKVKEALFSSVQFELSGAVCLDLFAGSGQLGLEALSRGAKFCYFVECDRENAEVIKANISKCNLEEKSSLKIQDARTFCRKIDVDFDMIFLDPPYKLGLLTEVLPNLSERIRPHGKIICEHESSLNLPEEIGNAKIHKTYKYGIVNVTTYMGKSD
jgi:16S rRNA (guanine(966)-N(2))-methyltransferase RsmD